MIELESFSKEKNNEIFNLKAVIEKNYDKIAELETVSWKKNDYKSVEKVEGLCWESKLNYRGGCANRHKMINDSSSFFVGRGEAGSVKQCAEICYSHPSCAEFFVNDLSTECWIASEGCEKHDINGFSAYSLLIKIP